MGWLWLALVLACGGGSPGPVRQELALGQTATLPHRAVTIDAVKDHGDQLPDYRGFIAEPRPGTRFVEVAFRERNLGPDVVGSAFLPLLVDDQARTHSGVAPGIAKLYLPKGALEYRFHQIPVGEEYSFVAIYEVTPADATGLHIELSASTDAGVLDVRVPLGL